MWAVGSEATGSALKMENKHGHSWQTAFSQMLEHIFLKEDLRVSIVSVDIRYKEYNWQLVLIGLDGGLVSEQTSVKFEYNSFQS